MDSRDREDMRDMGKLRADDIRVDFDLRTRSATVTLDEHSALIPFPVYSQREADILGREFARNLGWFSETKAFNAE